MQQDTTASRLRHDEPSASIELPYRSSQESAVERLVNTSARSSLALNRETSVHTTVHPEGSTSKALKNNELSAKMLSSFDDTASPNPKATVASYVPISQHYGGQTTHVGRGIGKLIHLKAVQMCFVWKWEIFTWLVGSSTFIANLILLSYFNGKLQKDWHSSIQITTFVAALAQASQSALLVPITSSIAQLRWRWVSSGSHPAVDVELFDLASRGPYGSVALLWYFAWKQHLVSIGALSTILLLGFPTFIQQAVQLGTSEMQSLAWPNTRQGGVCSPKNITISAPPHQVSSQSPWFTIGSYTDPALMAAIEKGLAGTEMVAPFRDPNATCPADRCVWPPIVSLGICSRVDDVSDTILFDDQYLSPIPPHIPMGGHNFTEAGAPSVPYQISQDSTFRVQTNFFAADRLDSGDDPTSVLRTRATPNNTVTHLPDVAHVILTYRDRNRGIQYKGAAEDRNLWAAYKATFGLCLRKYNTSYNTSGWNTAMIAQYSELEWEATDTDTGAVGNETFGNADVTRCAWWPQMEYGRSCVHESVLRLMGGQLATTLDIKVNLDGTNSQGYISDSPWTPTLVADLVGSGALESIAGVEPKSIEGFTQRVDKIAMSLSNALAAADQSGSFTWGDAYRREEIIKVNFIWLILPATLYIMLSGFLFATMYQTRDLPPWKYSTLAVLWCKEGGGNQLSTTKQMEARGEQAKVQLVEEDNAWRLVETYEMS